MASQSAYSSTLGHNAGEIVRLHMRSNSHLDVLSSRGMISDGSAYLPASKRQRLGLCEKIGDAMDHHGFPRYQIEGKQFCLYQSHLLCISTNIDRKYHFYSR